MLFYILGIQVNYTIYIPGIQVNYTILYPRLTSGSPKIVRAISLFWYKFLTFDTLLIICKKMQICNIFHIYCNIKLLSKNVQKQKLREIIIKYTFLKIPYPGEFKNFQKLNFFSRKTENLQIFFHDICAKSV